MTQPATAREDATARPDDGRPGQPLSRAVRRRVTAGHGRHAGARGRLRGRAPAPLRPTSSTRSGSGDTVSHIAVAHGRQSSRPSPARTACRAPPRSAIGQTLTIPTGPAAAPAPAAPVATTYTVAAGDTVSRIATHATAPRSPRSWPPTGSTRGRSSASARAVVPGASRGASPVAAVRSAAPAAAAAYTVVSGDTVSAHRRTPRHLRRRRRRGQRARLPCASSASASD